ncbi:alpha/beta fold hydrolase [Nocardia sp. NPDC004340]
MSPVKCDRHTRPRRHVLRDMTLTTEPTRPDWLTTQDWPHPLYAFDLDGRRVVYTDTGGDRPVLLMVHAGLWSLLWADLISHLEDRYRCVTLDLPGTGLSDPGEATVASAAHTITSFIDHLDLDAVTLVVHDLGGLAALAAVHDRVDRVAALVAMNTFGWQPRGILWLALRFFGSELMREVDAWLGLIAWVSATRFGVGRRWNRTRKTAWRRGLRDRDRRRFLHRMFRDATRDRATAARAASTVTALTGRPMMTVFGRLGDYFFFVRRWRRLFPYLTRVTVPWGLHFPMADNPQLAAEAIDCWHRGCVVRARQ